MNITFYTSNTEFPDYHSLTLAADRTKQSVRKGTGDYDKLTINKSQVPVEESSFARVLARETAGRLEGGAGQERVMKLQQQVASGTYQPDAKRIAERMLGYR